MELICIVHWYKKTLMDCFDQKKKLESKKTYLLFSMKINLKVLISI